jgi:non-heme chloroperoxidase
MAPAQPGKYLTVDPGVEIYYEEYGEGAPLVFVPGWTFTTEVFERQVAEFAKTHHVIVMDPRSQGRSSKTLYGNDYATHGIDLSKLITALELRQAVLVGWSTGILDVLSFVNHAGTASLKGAVLIDMSPKPLSVSAEDWVEGPLDEIADAFRTFLRTPEGQRDFIKWYADEVMIQADVAPETMDWVVRQSLTTPHYIASSLFADAMFCDYREDAVKTSTEVPTLYVIAEHWADTAVPFVQGNFPKIRTEVFGGHMMFWEHADRFNATLRGFIDSL